MYHRIHKLSQPTHTSTVEKRSNPLLRLDCSGLGLMNCKASPYYLEQKDALQRDMDKVLGTDGVLLYPSHPLLAPKHHHPLFTLYNFAYTGDTGDRNHIHYSIIFTIQALSIIYLQGSLMHWGYLLPSVLWG